MKQSLSNYSLPDLQVNHLTPEKTVTSGWMPSKKPKWSFNYEAITTKNVDVLNMRMTNSVFPGRLRKPNSKRVNRK